MKNSLKFLIIAAVLVAMLFSSGCSRRLASGQKIALKPCGISGLKADCGKLQVLEDRTAGTGRMIEINFMVVRAANWRPQPDPLFYFAGGPGMAGTQLYGLATGMFAQIHQGRDIVFFDQRGAGQSNNLVCPLPNENESPDAYVNRCLEALPGDPRFYTTAIAMDDVDELRQALGYDKINLYGISYGVTAAQVYMNRHPEHVRSAVLDHGTLLQVSFNNVLARNSQLVLDKVFDRCQADSACSTAYPNLREEFAALLDTLASPVKTNQFDPNTSQPVTLTRGTFASTVHYLLKSADRIALLPSLIHTAAQGNWDPFASKYLQVAREGAANEFMVMRQVILCYEDWVVGSTDELTRLGNGSYYLPNTLEDQKKYEQGCTMAPDPGESAYHGPALPADFPVLLFTGDSDPQNPPENVAGYHDIWPNSLDVVQPGVSHEYPSDPCWNSIIAAFVKTGSVKDLPLGCVASFTPPAFK